MLPAEDAVLADWVVYMVTKRAVKPGTAKKYTSGVRALHVQLGFEWIPAYSGHSFRRGGATAASGLAVADHLIQAHAGYRWRHEVTDGDGGGHRRALQGLTLRSGSGGFTADGAGGAARRRAGSHRTALGGIGGVTDAIGRGHKRRGRGYRRRRRVTDGARGSTGGSDGGVGRVTDGGALGRGRLTAARAGSPTGGAGRGHRRRAAGSIRRALAWSLHGRRWAGSPDGGARAGHGRRARWAGHRRAGAGRAADGAVMYEPRVTDDGAGRLTTASTGLPTALAGHRRAPGQ
ncbi:hypothetical protein CYMTET_24474, partial [Cymbomonas tetramitiformis]